MGGGGAHIKNIRTSYKFEGGGLSRAHFEFDIPFSTKFCDVFH